MNHGRYVPYLYDGEEQEISQHMFDSIFASSAMPGIFPFEQRGDQVLLDGGIVWISDATTAIEWCKDQGYAEENILVDWIVCEADYVVPKEDIVDFRTVGIALRAYGLNSFFGARNDIDRTLALWPTVNFRYIIGPSESLQIKFLVPLDFSREHLDKSIRIGEKDATNAIEHGPKVYTETLLNRWHMFGTVDEMPTMDALLSQQSKLISE